MEKNDFKRDTDDMFYDVLEITNRVEQGLLTPSEASEIIVAIMLFDYKVVVSPRSILNGDRRAR